MVNAVTTKVRNSNIELFRIIVMFFIVAHHSIVNSGLMPLIIADYPSKKSIFLVFFGWAGKVGINCFVLITGYFMCTSQITLRKGLKLLLQVEFYKIILFCIFVVSGYVELSHKTLFKGLMPITNISDGFVSCFLAFFCFIPFLNILIKGMNKRQHLILVCLSLVVYSLPSQIFMEVTFNYVGWFMVIYLIASYFRLYPPQWSNNTTKTGLLAVLLLTISLLSVLAWPQYCIFRGREPSFYFFVIDSNKPLAVATAITLFLFFKNVRIGYSRVINTIAASAFGVLLIHANSDAMRQWLWKDTLNNAGHFEQDICLYAVMSVTVIYITCTIIDIIRIQLFERPIFKAIDAFLNRGNKKIS